MVAKQIVKKKLMTELRQLFSTAYNCEDRHVSEAALLERNIRNLFSYLTNAGLSNYPSCPKPNELYHKIPTDSIGTFYATIGIDRDRNIILFIVNWDWRIDPNVFPNLYQLVLSMHPIYDIVSTDNCGFSIVRDARGYYNYINDQKQLISKEWFQKVTPFQNINNYTFAYIRRLNGDIYQIDETGMLHKIDDNYTKWNADALLGESHITHIIIEVINNYLKKNLLLAS